MSAELVIGLRISVIGLGVTFLALGLLSLVMRYLPTLFPASKPIQTPTKPIEEQNDNQDELLAVAMAVGICLLEERHILDHQDPSLGQLLETKYHN
jgi:Na+-transporting methylmalonyl-CoA/oxaloacetate decarboxylase gamma subunit